MEAVNGHGDLEFTGCRPVGWQKRRRSLGSDAEMAIELSETSIIIQQLVDAPRDRVWHAWTAPNEIDRWWGPIGTTTTTRKMHVETGGEWIYTMTDADGTGFPHRVTFKSVVKPDRIDYTLKPDEPEVSDQLEVSVQFTEQAGNTHVRMDMLFESPADRDDAIEYGVAEGTSETLARLASIFEDEDRSGVTGPS